MKPTGTPLPPGAPCQISVVVPVYGCRDCLLLLCQRLTRVLRELVGDSYEILLVDDRSPDSSWETIVNISKSLKHVKRLRLSKNFGQHNAISAGLDYSTGRWICVMDCDLQDQPEVIPDLYREAILGHEVIIALRESRDDSYLKKLGSKLFFSTLNFLGDLEIDSRIGNFGMYSARVIRAIQSLPERFRSFGLLTSWVGFHRVYVNVERSRRLTGVSTYSFNKLLRLATESFISYSDKLLRLSLKIGFFVAFASACMAMYFVLRYFVNGSSVTGWTSIIIAILFSTGVITTAVGVVGLYVGRILDEVKHRPCYLIDELTFPAARTPHTPTD